MLNAVKIALACLLTVAAIAGCLKSDPPTDSPATGPPAATGYTGAIVFVDEDCMPCEFLKNDIDWLIRRHGWLKTDFRIQQSPPNQAVPQIVFMRDGRPVGRPVVGYSQGPQAERMELLKQICRRHPARL